MREATYTPSTTRRRGLLGAAGFTALAGIAAAAIGKPDAAAETLPNVTAQDADLIALAGRFMVLQAAIDAFDGWDDDATVDDVHRPRVKKQAKLLDEMGSLVATTPAGHRARAGAFLAWYGIRAGNASPHTIDHDRLWPILRDLIGEAA